MPRIQGKLNGLTIGLDKGADRGITVSARPAGEPDFKLQRLLTLSPGRNEIRVTVFNRTGDVQSTPAVLVLTCKDDISTEPSLFLLTVGINEYRDGALRLNYSVADAEAISKAFTKYASPLFKEVHATHVFDADATLKGIESAFGELAGKVTPYDVFVLYVAGHGVTQDGRYYLLPHDFRYRGEASIAEDGVSQAHLQRWLSSIPARKSIVLLDTCNSGSFAQSGMVTRGLEEKSAISRLTRATGRAIIVAAKDDQPALEGYDGHGIFTYALLRAFDRADQVHGNRDRITSLFEIAAYIDEQVPQITYQQFGYEQIPQVSMQGRDFPVAMFQ